jgi:hypothetical protein
VGEREKLEQVGGKETAGIQKKKKNAQPTYAVSGHEFLGFSEQFCGQHATACCS